LGIFTRDEREEKGGLWGGIGLLDPPSKQPFTIRERFCEKVHKVCVRSAKIVHVLQKEFKRGVFSSNSHLTPTNKTKTRSARLI
jgi:hypothetical protein